MNLDWIDDALAELDRAGLRRRLRTFAGPQEATCQLDGRTILNFASNDYLALAADERLAAAAREATVREGWGAGASPLIAGHRASHEALEQRLARFEGVEAALWFTSGYTANVGAVTALAGRGDAVFGDALNHASLIDGCRLSRAEVYVYPHRDCAALEEMLKAAQSARRRLIVTDSVFSMDGDLAPLADLADLAERYNTMLLVDEAHATGVFGKAGRGLCEAVGVEHLAVRVGTLSKALGSAGGFVCGSRSLIEWLLNRARSYIFSTAPPAALAAAAIAAIDIVEAEPWRREQLLARATETRAALAAQGWDVGQSASQIIPLAVGEAQRAVDLSAKLWEAGLFIPAIRPPSVPKGESRLRLSLSFGHSPEMLSELVAVLGQARSSAN